MKCRHVICVNQKFLGEHSSMNVSNFDESDSLKFYIGERVDNILSFSFGQTVYLLTSSQVFS
jgi:hypothetical protein